MFNVLSSYHWFNATGRMKAVYTQEKIPHKTPFIIKTMEDLNKHVCIITIQIGYSDIFDVIVTDDNNNIDYTNKINFMMLAMLRLANKKGVN